MGAYSKADGESVNAVTRVREVIKRLGSVATGGDTLMRETGLDRTSIFKALGSLIEQGEVDVIQTPKGETATLSQT